MGSDFTFPSPSLPGGHLVMSGYVLVVSTWGGVYAADIPTLHRTVLHNKK